MEKMENIEHIEIIKSHFQVEATAFKNAGAVLRGALNGVERMEAYSERVQRLKNCEALLDAALDLGELAIGSGQ